MKKTASDHWRRPEFLNDLRAALRSVGKDPDTRSAEDLFEADQFHGRGLAATEDLAERLQPAAGMHIVDVGCGIGGPARYFAQRFGCRVTGVDITPEFIEAGRALTRQVGLEDQVTLLEGDGAALPLPDAAHDGALLQNVTMNVADKAALYAEAARVLKPGAFLCVTEAALGPAGDPIYPMPWSDDGETSFLVTPRETESLIRAAGFTDISVEDESAHQVASAKKMRARIEAGEIRPPLGPRLLMGELVDLKQANSIRNLETERLRFIHVWGRTSATR